MEAIRSTRHVFALSLLVHDLLIDDRALARPVKSCLRQGSYAAFNRARIDCPFSVNELPVFADDYSAVVLISFPEPELD